MAVGGMVGKEESTLILSISRLQQFTATTITSMLYIVAYRTLPPPLLKILSCYRRAAPVWLLHVRSGSNGRGWVEREEGRAMVDLKMVVLLGVVLHLMLFPPWAYLLQIFGYSKEFTGILLSLTYKLCLDSQVKLKSTPLPTDVTLTFKLQLRILQSVKGVHLHKVSRI